MQIVSLACGNCGAKLKVKRLSATVTQVKCPKCQKPIPLPRETAAEAEATSAVAPPAPPPVPPTDTASPAATPAPLSVPPPTPEAVSAALATPVTLAIPPPPAAPATEPKKPIVLSPLGKTSAGLVSVVCESCKREMKVPGELAGKKVRCKTCGTPVAVQEPSAGPAPVVIEEQVQQFQTRLAAAETRAQVAEKALQDLAAQKAQEIAVLQNRIAELESQLATCHDWKERTRRELQAEVETAEKRLAELKARLTRLA